MLAQSLVAGDKEGAKRACFGQAGPSGTLPFPFEELGEPQGPVCSSFSFKKSPNAGTAWLELTVEEAGSSGLQPGTMRYVLAFADGSVPARPQGTVTHFMPAQYAGNLNYNVPGEEKIWALRASQTTEPFQDLQKLPPASHESGGERVNEGWYVLWMMTRPSERVIFCAHQGDSLGLTIDDILAYRLQTEGESERVVSCGRWREAPEDCWYWPWPVPGGTALPENKREEAVQGVQDVLNRYRDGTYPLPVGEGTDYAPFAAAWPPSLAIPAEAAAEELSFSDIVAETGDEMNGGLHGYLPLEQGCIADFRVLEGERGIEISNVSFYFTEQENAERRTLTPEEAEALFHQLGAESGTCWQQGDWILEAAFADGVPMLLGYSALGSGTDRFYFPGDAAMETDGTAYYLTAGEEGAEVQQFLCEPGAETVLTLRFREADVLEIDIRRPPRSVTPRPDENGDEHTCICKPLTRAEEKLLRQADEYGRVPTQTGYLSTGYEQLDALYRRTVGKELLPLSEIEREELLSQLGLGEDGFWVQENGKEVYCFLERDGPCVQRGITEGGDVQYGIKAVARDGDSATAYWFFFDSSAGDTGANRQRRPLAFGEEPSLHVDLGAPGDNEIFLSFMQYGKEEPMRRYHYRTKAEMLSK